MFKDGALKTAENSTSSASNLAQSTTPTVLLPHRDHRRICVATCVRYNRFARDLIRQSLYS